MYFMLPACGRPQGGGGGPAHVDKGKGVKNQIFFVDIINRWPLKSGQTK